MKQKTFFIIIGIIFTVLGILHLLRIIFSWYVNIENFQVPMWFSYIAVLFSIILSYHAFKLSNKQ